VEGGHGGNGFDSNYITANDPVVELKTNETTSAIATAMMGKSLTA